MNSIKNTARLAGLLYLILAAVSYFGLVYVPSMLIVSGDSAATVGNIVANESLFRLGVVSNLLAFTVNIFVVVFLYKLLKPVNEGMASLMVIFILVGIAIAMLNELNQVAVLLSSGADYSAAFTVPLFLDLYEHGFIIAHIFFGLWLFPMGYLIFKSGFLPRFLGVLLIIAGSGYLADFILFFLFPGVDVRVSEFTFVGEVALLLWLLIRGVNVEKWEKRARTSTSRRYSPADDVSEPRGDEIQASRSKRKEYS
ncbi:MAG: DUF4386 domain-containing protein [Actinomycetota bacterium]|jgi:hypothetical protein|nr:DUF4386 domain-containing protein [Actinomycetota bacterium]